MEQQEGCQSEGETSQGASDSSNGKEDTEDENERDGTDSNPRGLKRKSPNEREENMATPTRKGQRFGGNIDKLEQLVMDNPELLRRIKEKTEGKCANCTSENNNNVMECTVNNNKGNSMNQESLGSPSDTTVYTRILSKDDKSEGNQIPKTVDNIHTDQDPAGKFLKKFI